MKKRKWLSLLLAVMMLVSAMPFFPVTADAADGTVEVSTWAELKKALDYTTNCSVVKVVKDIETKSLNGHTGLHQDNIIFMTMAMDKVLDLNGHTVNAYVKYYSEVGQGYLINISHKDARLTIRDSVGGGALIGEFNQEFYYEFINVSKGTLVMESGTVKMLCPSKDNQYTKCAISVSGTAVFNGGEVLTQVTSPGGEKEERYLSRRLQAIRGEAGGSVTINGGTFDRVVLHSAPTPENLGKYELVVNGGFFRQSIALILTGDVYASNFDHLPMQINDAYFMRTTDKLDQCRLVLGGKMKNFYDRNWDYDIHYNDIPGATLDDAKTMMWGLVPHLISENGAVFTDVHDGNWYVRGNMRRSVENGGPTMAFQGTSLGIQGGIAKVISNAYGVKEVLLDGEPMEYGERGFSAPQVDTTAEQEHRVSFVMYPISPMLRVLGYSYSNEYSTGYIRMFVSDHHTGQGMVHFPSVPASGDQPFSVTYYINESDVDALTTMELQYDLMLETNGVKKQVSTGYKGAKVVQWVDHTQTIDTVYLDISQPLVQGDYSSGTFTVDGSAPYAIEEKPDYWMHEDIWDLTGNVSVPAILGDQYSRFIRVYLKDGYEGYKFDKKNPPKIKIRGLNRECDSIDVRVANDERSLGVSLASHPSEVIQSAWGTVAGLRAGSPVGGVNIQEKGSDFELNIKEIQRVKNGTVYSTSPDDVIDPDYIYRIKVVGTGKNPMTFRNGPEQYDITFHYYHNTNVKLRMYSDTNIAENYREVPYDASAQAYVIDLVPEPDVINYDYLSLSVPHPWAGERPIYNNNLVTGLPGGVSVVSYTWYASATGERIQADMTFNAGRRYHVNMILQCEEGYYIADDEELDAYVNGEKAYVSAQDGNRTTLTVGYTVPVASGVRGQVVSFHDGSDVTVSLFADGSAQPQYTVAVPAGEKSGGKYTAVYDIPEVAPGTYTMQVSKKNHVTREYIIDVGTENVTQNVKIHLLGDIDGNGTVTTMDFMRANSHARGVTLLTDYALKCADVVGTDGKVTTMDAMRINAHARGTAKLW
jgi:hypothetical protein